MIRQELVSKINQLGSELKQTKQKLNKLSAMDANLIQLFTDGESACLKLYINDKELSIAFKRHVIESEYNGNNCFIPDETALFDLDGNNLSNDQSKEHLQIATTDDLMIVLNGLDR